MMSICLIEPDLNIILCLEPDLSYMLCANLTVEVGVTLDFPLIPPAFPLSVLSKNSENISVLYTETASLRYLFWNVV